MTHLPKVETMRLNHVGLLSRPLHSICLDRKYRGRPHHVPKRRGRRWKVALGALLDAAVPLAILPPIVIKIHPIISSPQPPPRSVIITTSNAFSVNHSALIVGRHPPRCFTLLQNRHLRYLQRRLLLKHSSWDHSTGRHIMSLA